MLRHYILVAFRNFRRSPVATAINVLALTLGLSCFVVAYAVVEYWGHAESHFAKAARTYAITREFRLKDGSIDTGNMPSTNILFAKYMKLDFPEFETIVRARSGGEVPFGVDDKQIRLPTAYVDPEFLDVFDLPFIAGGGKDALKQPNSVVLTDVAAMRFFGTADIVGRTLHIGTWDLTVTGVIGPIPQPSHLGRSASAGLRFDALVSWDVWDRIDKALQPAPDPNAPKQPENWLGGYCCVTYVVLPKGSKATPESLQPEFDAFVKRHVPPEQLKMVDFTVGMMPIRGMMAKTLENVLFSGKNVGVSVPSLLMLFGGLILLVACVNYANLATAQAMKRAKEVGLRKAIGASRTQIASQYLLEAALLASAALVLALGVTLLIAPVVKNATDIDLSFALFSGAKFWIFLVGVIAGVGMVAGAYPAFYLSRVRPILALKPGDSSSGSRLMPTLLVGAQFMAASFLLIAVIVMQAQSSDLRRTGLGTDKDPVISITNIVDLTKVNSLDFADAVRRLPQVKSASAMGDTPWSSNVNLTDFQRSEAAGSKRVTAYQNTVDYGFFETMNIPLLAGRAYDRNRGDDRPLEGVQSFDPARPANIVVDRAFIERLGFASPQAAVGQIIYLPLSMAKRPDQPCRIIGVVENKPLHFVGMGATSNVYFLGTHLYYSLVRVSGDDVPGAIAAIHGVWQRMAPQGTYFYHDFVDQLFAQSYELFGRVNLVFGGLALFAFVISTIGLVGMAGHVAGRRRREIGVRKTLGASTRQILVMLLKDFSKPVVVANVIAWPLAYLAVEAYLSIFIHRISLSPIPFALSLAATILIAWVAVGGQAVRAARVKPANVLRYE
jgi:putative ABC transport system permease protein